MQDKNGNAQDALIESMKDSLHARIDQWLGFDIPAEGEEDYDRWKSMVAEVNAIENFLDVMYYLESEGIDVADFLVCGDWDLTVLDLGPSDFPLEAASALGEEIASQSWSGGSWSTVFRYGDLFFVIDEVETSAFDNVKDAFERAGIGRDTYDDILHLKVSPEYQDLIVPNNRRI